MKLAGNNPYTGELLYMFDEMHSSEVDQIIEQVNETWDYWKVSGFEERILPMRKLSQILARDKARLGMEITREMGKPISQAVAEVEKCAWVCDYYAENAQNFLSHEIVQTDADVSYIRYDPIGVILAVMPWNFPFWQVFRFTAPALMAGNGVLLKHSSNSQLSAQIIEELIIEAGFPKNIFRNLRISSGMVERVIENPLVKAVSLTGSEKAGISVGRIAGENIKKTVLELGGCNAFIVLEDADIRRAAETGLMARVQNGGQSCIASKRFILHENIADSFIAEISGKIKELKVGDPSLQETEVGPLASVEQAIEVERQVNDSVREGARILLGGSRKEAFYMPTLMTHVTPGMPVFDEEVFGPVIPVITFRNIEECIRLSNLSSYGLGVTLFTQDIAMAERLAAEFEDGAVFVNSLVKSDPRLPFGGTKHSGFGRELSYHGIREFVNVKTVFIKNNHQV